MAILKPVQKSPVRPSLGFNRLMAILALVNLGLVLFDLSYIPWRDTYLRYFPELTQWYGDRFKGIKPHRDTQAYLKMVGNLTTQVQQTGLQSPQVGSLLKELRTLSDQMIDEDPFQTANKSGTLERIKNQMRDRTGNLSSHESFATFWSQAYLNKAGWSREMTFFNRDIRPLIKSNYFRGINENGGFIDQFWKIDIGFVGLFAAEFLARTFYLSRRYKGTRWLDAMLWRWYDLPLLIPFWRWLRVIPVTVRLNQARLLNLEPIRTRINHGLVASFAIELTEIVVLRVIDQLQDLIRQGKVTRWLLQPEAHRRYIDLNGVDEVEAIAKRLISILVHQVLPKVKPDLEALVHHGLTNLLQQNSAYRSIQQIPGLSNLPLQLTEALVAEASKTAYGTLVTSVEDPVTAKLFRHLVESFGEAFRSEIRQETSLKEFESLIIVMLDEIKINYVRELADQDIEQLRDQTHHLYGMTQVTLPPNQAGEGR